MKSSQKSQNSKNLFHLILTKWKLSFQWEQIQLNARCFITLFWTFLIYPVHSNIVAAMNFINESFHSLPHVADKQKTQSQSRQDVVVAFSLQLFRGGCRLSFKSKQQDEAVDLNEKIKWNWSSMTSKKFLFHVSFIERASPSLFSLLLQQITLFS